MPDAPVARAWDLLTDDDAASFLAPEGLAASLVRDFLPCRVLWIPPGLAPAMATAPTAARLLHGRRGAVLAGPASALRAGVRALGGAAGAALDRALDGYERPASALRFADGSTWDLGGTPRLMGIVNVTPDSFSDGGRFFDPRAALRHAERLLAEGADIVDLGAESTRPGAADVSPEAELERLAPVLRALRRDAPQARLSVDTRRAAVARAALDLGADMVNDVSGLGDPAMAAIVASAGAPVVLMHMRGTPATMQHHAAYEDVAGEVCAALAAAAASARKAGIADDRILLDPGLGFAKTAEGNEILLRQLRSFLSLNQPLLVGASRKSFIGLRSGVKDPGARVAGSLAAALEAARAGAAVLRVHDVAATREALLVQGAIISAGGTA